MKSVTNMNPAKKQITLDEQKKSNKLNDFYLRFERQNFSQECDRVLQSLPDTAWKLTLTASDVSIVEYVRARPQALMACQLFLPKSCAEQLTTAWCPIFQQTLNTLTVPALWKKSIITPVPKKPSATVNNDFRPIALTSIVMKCFEKCVVSLLTKDVEPCVPVCV